MKINSNIIHIPPYISTSWKNIMAIHVDKESEDGKKTLVFSLTSGSTIVVPGLDGDVVDSIFEAHGNYLENDHEDEKETSAVEKRVDHMQSFLKQMSNTPVSGFLSDSDGGIDLMMQHNPSQSNMPNLPREMLSKIVALTQSLDLGDDIDMPKPEPECNCIHCQIARAIHVAKGYNEEDLEEEVSDEDLTFRSWDIENTSDKLYIVTNRLDDKEQYNVFLGDPIGCTCGELNCEHIKAVLRS